MLSAAPFEAVHANQLLAVRGNPPDAGALERERVGGLLAELSDQGVWLLPLRGVLKHAKRVALVFQLPLLQQNPFRFALEFALDFPEHELGIAQLPSRAPHRLQIGLRRPPGLLRLSRHDLRAGSPGA